MKSCNNLTEKNNKKKFIKLNHSDKIFPKNTKLPGFLGWWFVDENGKWLPAEDLKISENNRIAIFIFGADSVLPELGPFFQTLNKYDKILAIRYNTCQSVLEKTGSYLFNLLVELVPLARLNCDIFAYGLGAIIIRFIMEIYGLGRFHQFQHVVLIGNYTQGLLTQYGLFENPDGELAIKISNGILAQLLVPILNLPVNIILDNIIYQFKGNVEQNSFLPNISKFTKILNTKKISDSVFENLKYYTLNGYIPDQHSVSDLKKIFKTDNPYIYIANNIYNIYNEDTKLLAWQTDLPSQGQLANFAWKLALSIEPIIFDGFANSANNLLTKKSKFYSKNRIFSEILVPRNHKNLIIPDEYMQIVYKDIVSQLTRDK